MVLNAAPRRSSLGARLALLGLGQFIVTLDFNIVYVALPDIGHGLGFSAQSLQWVVSAYVVVLGGLLLAGGRAADRLGQRRMFLLGLAVYAASSLVGGFAVDSGMLIAARAVQGIGGALLTPATLRLIFTNFEEGAPRNRAFATWGAAGSGGLSAGALIGGLLVNYLGWEWVFFVNVPLAVIAMIATPSVFAPDAPRPVGQGGFDLLGAVIATIGASLIVFGLVQGPQAGWLSLSGVWPIVLGIVALGVFVLVEARTASPLMPLRLTKVRGLVVAMAVAFLFQGALAAVYYVLTTFFQDVNGYSAIEAGLAFLPPTLLSMVVALRLTARSLDRWGIRATLVAGLFITGAGTAGLAGALSVHASYWVLLPGLLVWGFGGGLAFSPLFAAAGLGVQLAEQGVASAMANTTRQIGGAVGLAALVAVANAGLSGHPAVVDTVGGLRDAGWLAAAVTIVAALLAVVLSKPKPKAALAAETSAAEEAVIESAGDR